MLLHIFGAVFGMVSWLFSRSFDSYWPC